MMDKNALHEIATAMMARGRGILAADESTGTIEKRFRAVGVENVEENRRAYRELLFTGAGVEDYISGVIFYEETLFQKTADGVPFPKLLESKGIIPGIKVDKGAKPLANAPGETITEGLDGLRERLEKYHAAGARFAKWRGVIDIGAAIPSDYCIHVNAHALARYAALCQEANIVPIVEPEVLMDGDNTIEICRSVTERTLKAVFDELHAQHVLLEGMILKPNMVVSGMKCPVQADRHRVAVETLQTLKRLVPSMVPGVAFLSGGQSDEDATAHLDEMNRLGGAPWVLTFSYGRALQAAAQKAWSGRKNHFAAGQRAFLHRAKMNSLAAGGHWKSDLEKAA
jgi:fructose-bisphosphate aldolase class I